MTSSLQTLLSELYEIDPSLKDHESELIPLLEQLLKHDPAQTPDATFVATLRRQLRERAAVLSSSTGKSTWQKWVYAFGGAVTAAVILPIVYIAWHQPSNPAMQIQSNSSASGLFAYRIQQTNDHAFGSLSDVAGGGGIVNGSRTGGGGGGPETTAPMAANQAQSDAKLMAPVPPYEMTQYDYIFDGTLPELSGAKVPVYKHDPSTTRLPLSSIADSLNLGTLNLGSFQGMNVDSMTFSQNTPLGYQMTVSLRDASVNINAQWETWRQSSCTTDECFQRERTKISDIPPDDALIGIAKTFAEEHGIDLAHYGTPEVDTPWKADYQRTSDQGQAYIPDSLRVIFPLLIDNKPVYDQSGLKTGISMGVNVKEKKVMDVWGIADRTYEKSDYDGVTDAATIKEYLSKIDHFDPAATMPEGTKVHKVQVTLGTPVVSYALYYRNDKALTTELLVPSLIFPVQQTPGSTELFYRTSIVVPLATDMLEQQQPSGVMPLEKPVMEVAPR